MSKRSIDDLGELQRSVMEVVWELGGATVRDVRKRLKRRKRPAYTTVLTVMQKLEKLGLLRHREEGKTYVYLPTQTLEQAGTNSLRQFIDRVFQGNPLLLFQRLMDDKKLSEEEIAELRKMLNRRRRKEDRDG